MPRTSRLRDRLLGVVAASTLGTSLLLAPSPGHADESASPTPAPSAEVGDATRLAAKAYPGVQLISTTYTATVSVRVPVINQVAVNALAQRLAIQAANGGMDFTEEAVTEEIVDALVKSPNTYFVAGAQQVSRRRSLTGVGTGWVITPDGYLVTAAHVVDTSDAQLRQEFASSALNRLGRQFVRGLQNSGTQLTPDQVSRLTDAVLGWLAAHMSVGRLDVSVSADLALGFDGLGKDQRAVEAEVVDVGKPYPGSDVALLKIDGQDNLPTIPLGDNDDVSPGSTVHVVGFPAASTFSPGLSRDSQVQPTVTQGPVTAVKSMDNGMPVFQTQAPASPGNSGGPVLTDGGEAIGVLVASAVGNDGVAAQGQNFVIPASEVLDMLGRNGVTPAESDTTTTYDQAIDAFYDHHYKDAVPLLERVETLYPAHPFAQKFISDSKAAIDEGLDESPVEEESGGPSALLLGLGAAALLLLLGGGAGAWLLVRRRSARPAPAGQFPTPAFPAGPPPVPGPVPAPMSAGPPPMTSATPAPPTPRPEAVWDPERGWHLPDAGTGPAPAPAPTPGSTTP
ncbi:Trypsin-like peptidase domain-containing protein [Nocardioides exalbidus]|uniref:Trypsin-like peptidase domain-containing protein n=1 Tax=Nocardioides exalbidus TaxID=402596 RepID=A0A1H4QN86_9ACTN|nr:serine protease [Nocardioides exalbidus]SEC21116.1 Trypsin-like peptidase domain-containing protein [Nocardioides exalbidus]